jgi:hypothetical protein
VDGVGVGVGRQPYGAHEALGAPLDAVPPVALVLGGALPLPADLEHLLLLHLHLHLVAAHPGEVRHEHVRRRRLLPVHARRRERRQAQRRRRERRQRDGIHERLQDVDAHRLDDLRAAAGARAALLLALLLASQHAGDHRHAGRLPCLSLRTLCVCWSSALTWWWLGYWLLGLDRLCAHLLLDDAELAAIPCPIYRRGEQRNTCLVT